MRWFRSHIQLGSRLALFALTIQFALAFAHVHVDQGLRPAGSKFAAPAGVQAPSDAANSPIAPAKPHPRGFAGDICSICVLLHMAGSSPPAASPELQLPAAFGSLVPGITPAVALRRIPHVLAQARAPPNA
jgi:hypothetical protein